jgi:hypothetical protein
LLSPPFPTHLSSRNNVVEQLTNGEGLQKLLRISIDDNAKMKADKEAAVQQMEFTKVMLRTHCVRRAIHYLMRPNTDKHHRRTAAVARRTCCRFSSSTTSSSSSSIMTIIIPTIIISSSRIII